jgi:dolichol-phosphate mannosyltransferase
MLASSSPYLAVIDADCQHDETALPRMLEVLKSGAADIVVGSRYVAGGGIGSWNASRARMSQLATRLSRFVIEHDLSDPMSGFFAMRRDVFELAVRKLSSVGFKILLDIVASSPNTLRVKEVPYEFRNRYAGESKLDGQALWGYLMLLADKLTRGVVPVRFISFSVMGAIGVVIHLSVLAALFRGFALPFTFSQTVATVIAMTSNFTLNNALTYRDMRLKGRAWVIGLVTFMLACSFGALANVGVASFLFKRDTFWVLSALLGIVVGTVWNYAMTATFTWEKHLPKANGN